VISRDSLPRSPCCNSFEWVELRYNPNNNGVAYQCGHCGASRSQWLKHAELQDVNVLALPKWAAPSWPGEQELPF
jgi:hypothetical protein